MSIDQTTVSGAEAPRATGPNGIEPASSAGGPGWLAMLKSSLGLTSSSLRDTLEQALRTGEGDDGAFSAEERAMLLRLLRYGGLRVEDVMVPRADIISVEESDTVADVLEVFVESGVSRVPVYIDTLDDPRGVIHVKDLIQALVAESTVAVVSTGSATATGEPVAVQPETGAEKDVALLGAPGIDLGRIDLARSIGSLKVRRPALFVPPSMPAMNLLLRMQSTRIHMALVVDEYGGTDGLVTIEDLVEQIVGDIDDEHDEAEDANIVVDAKQGLIASARTPVEELEKHLGMKLMSADDEDDVDTLGGMVFSLIGRVPSRGELIPHPAGLEFEVLDADPRRIKKLKVHFGKLAAPAAAPAAHQS